MTAPLPPADVATRRLPLQTITPDTPLWRVHDVRRDPLWFGPAPNARPTGRFDAWHGEYRVCYVGLSPEASFAETFLRNPGRRILDRTLLEYRALTVLAPTRSLRVVRLYGPALARLGATAEVTHGPAYDVAGQWSLALWSHPSQPDGIAYKSRHDDDEICVAIFDRRPDPLRIQSTEGLYRSRLLPALLQRYRVSFDLAG